MTSNTMQAFLAASRRAGIHAAAAPQRARVVIAIDATASRQARWDHACHEQAKMFDAAAALGGIDVSLIYFRGQLPPKVSPFVSSARHLTSVMTGIVCMGGLTQWTKVLGHIAAEHAKGPVAAAILIGDCMEDDEDEVFGKARDLGALGIKLFAFHEDIDDGHHVAAFREIARLSDGIYCAFDETSAGMLAELLAGVAAWASGGRAALAARGDAASRLLLGKLGG